MPYVNAFERPGECITATPATDFSEKRYTFGTISAAGALATPEAGASAIGVVQTPGIAGEPCNVMTTGVSFIVLGGTVAAGDDISTDANGKAVKATAQTQSGTTPFAVTAGTAVLGKCLVGGDAGEIGSILL
jgi:hypothetical protein